MVENYSKVYNNVELSFDDNFFTSVERYFDESQCYFRFNDTHGDLKVIPISQFKGRKISPSGDTLSLAVENSSNIAGEDKYEYSFIGKLKNNVILYGLSTEKDWTHKFDWTDIINSNGGTRTSSVNSSRTIDIDMQWTDNEYLSNTYGDKETYILKNFCSFTYASFDIIDNNTSDIVYVNVIPSVMGCNSAEVDISSYRHGNEYEVGGRTYQCNIHTDIRKNSFLGVEAQYNLTYDNSLLVKKICGCCYYNPFNEEYNNNGFGEAISVDNSITYPTIDVYVETNNDAFSELNDYCFMTYENYNNNLTSFYHNMFECFDKNHSSRTIRCATLGHKSWPNIHFSDKGIFLYGIGKKFLLCDLNGHMLLSAMLSDGTNVNLLQEKSALSSLDVKFIIKDDIDLLTKDPKPYFMNIPKDKYSMLWQYIADRTLFPWSDTKIDSLISNYNDYELYFDDGAMSKFHRYVEDTYSFENYNYYVGESTDNLFLSYNEYMGDFAAVVQANSYDDLKSKLKKIVVQHPQLKFAGFININDASYLYSPDGLQQNKSIFDDDIDFIACSNTVMKAVHKNEFYRPYHSIFLPVFFINSTMVVNVLGDESLRSIHNEKCNALTSLISALYPYSNESRIDNVYFNSWIDDQSIPSTLIYGTQQYPSTISASTVAEFKDAIISASIYSNIVYNINCNTNNNGYVNIGNGRAKPGQFVRILKAAATNATCFVTGQNAAKSLMLNPISQNNREYVFLADTKSNEFKSSFFYMVDSSGISRQQKLLSDKPFSLHVLNDYFDTNNDIHVPTLKNIYNNCNVEHIFKDLLEIFLHAIGSDNRLHNFISAYFHKKIILKLYDNENSSELNDNYETIKINICSNENYGYDFNYFSRYGNIGWYYTYLLSYDLTNNTDNCLSLFKLFISFIGLSKTYCSNGYASTFKSYFLSFADRLAQYNSSSTLYYDFYKTFNIHDTLKFNEIFIDFCENNCCNQFNNELKTIYQAAINESLTTNDKANYLNNIENNELKQKLIDYDFSELEVDDIITQTRNAYENVFRILLNMAFNMYLYVNDLQEMMPNVMNKLNNSEKFDLIFNIILQNAPHCGFLSKTKYTDDKVFLVE